MKKLILFLLLIPVFCFGQTNTTPQFKRNIRADSLLGYSIPGVTGNHWLPDTAWVKKHAGGSSGSFINNSSTLQTGAQFNILKGRLNTLSFNTAVDSTGLFWHKGDDYARIFFAERGSDMHDLYLLTGDNAHFDRVVMGSDVNSSNTGADDHIFFTANLDTVQTFSAKTIIRNELQFHSDITQNHTIVVDSTQLNSTITDGSNSNSFFIGPSSFFSDISDGTNESTISLGGPGGSITTGDASGNSSFVGTNTGDGTSAFIQSQASGGANSKSVTTNVSGGNGIIVHDAIDEIAFQADASVDTANMTTHPKMYTTSEWVKGWVAAHAGGSGVTSIFGRTGAVVAASNDYTFAQLASKPTTVSGYGITDAQATLVSGTNIKSINSSSILASGNINLQTPLTAGTDYLAPNGSAALLTSFPTLNQSTTGNAATATALQTARAINGTNFDGTVPITITAAAGTVTGTTLNSTVVNSSLTGVGTLVTGSIPYSLLTGTPSALPPNGTAAGELAGTYPNPTLLNSAVIAKVLTGYTSGAGTVASTDNILQAFQKLNGNDALKVAFTDTATAFANLVHINKSETILGAKTFSATPVFSNHITIDGVTTTGVTGTGNVVLATSPTIGGNLVVNGVNASVIGSNLVNLWEANSITSITNTDANKLFGGATTVFTRTAFNSGSTSTTLTTGASSAGTIFASNVINKFSSGTHAWINNVVINPIGTIGGSGATVTNTASLYVNGAGTGGTNNYALVVATGNSLFGGNVTLGTAGNKINITEGTNGSVGQTILVSGTKAITITGITTSTRAFVTLVAPTGTSLTTSYQAVCTANTLTIQANVAAGTINVADGSTLNYWVIN